MKSLVILVALAGTLMTLALGCGADYGERGRARRYEGKLSLALAGENLTIDGELTVDIRDFGLRPPKLLILRVDPIVKVRLHLVAAVAA